CRHSFVTSLRRPTLPERTLLCFDWLAPAIVAAQLCLHVCPECQLLMCILFCQSYIIMMDEATTSINYATDISI
ncbi:hypothetical protein L0F63_003183, partial [Massospora cicadina]